MQESCRRNRRFADVANAPVAKLTFMFVNENKKGGAKTWLALFLLLFVAKLCCSRAPDMPRDLAKLLAAKDVAVAFREPEVEVEQEEPVDSEAEVHLDDKKDGKDSKESKPIVTVRLVVDCSIHISKQQVPAVSAQELGQLPESTQRMLVRALALVGVKTFDRYLIEKEVNPADFRVILF